MKPFIVIIACLIPTVCAAHPWLPPYIPPARGATYEVPWHAIRPIYRWGVRARYQPQQAPQPQGRWVWQPGQYEFVPQQQYQPQYQPPQNTPQQK